MSMGSFLPFPCNDGILVDARRPTPHLKRCCEDLSMSHFYMLEPGSVVAMFLRFYDISAARVCANVLRPDEGRWKISGAE